MCIFEGSTVLLCLLYLYFLLFLDAVATFAFIRKIMNKFGMSGALGKRSQAAITKARKAKVDKIKTTRNFSTG